MTDAELTQFGELFRNVWATLAGYKADSVELDAKLRMYWQALRSLDWRAVQRGADRLLQVETKMPKPATWRDYAFKPDPAAPLDAMTASEAHECLSAEVVKWEAAVCRCGACVESGATAAELKARFVPLDPERRRAHPRSGQQTLVGHWLHGHALIRWYLAREQARDLWKKAGGGRAMPKLFGRRGLHVVPTIGTDEGAA